VTSTAASGYGMARVRHGAKQAAEAAKEVLHGHQQGLEQRDLLASVLSVDRCREHREGWG